MGKSTLKLTGVYEAWSRNVRQGRLTRANGTEAPVLVRVDDADATPELLLRLREDARLLGRLQHESVLRIEHISAVGGKVGVVYEGFECASASRILRVLRARNQVLPARAAVEAAAAVGLALDEALRIVDGDRAVHHPSPSPEDVLVDTAGRVKLAGFRVARQGDTPAPPPKGYLSPEGGSAPPAATYLVGALLVELLSGDSPPDAAAEPERHEAAVRRALIRVLARPGDTPGEPVVAAIRQALAHDPAVRGGPGALGKKLRELAVALQSPGLRAWAPGSIPSIQRFATPTADGRAGGAPLPFPTDDSTQRSPHGSSSLGAPLAAGQTLAPLDAESLLDGPRVDGPRVDGPRVDGPRVDPARPAASRAPLPEAPSRAYAFGAGTIVPPSELSEEILRASPPRPSGPVVSHGAPPILDKGAPGRPVAARGPASPMPSPTAQNPTARTPTAPTSSRAVLPSTGTGSMPVPSAAAKGGMSDLTRPAPSSSQQSSPRPSGPTTGAPRIDGGPRVDGGPAVGRVQTSPAAAEPSFSPAASSTPRSDGPAVAARRPPPGSTPMGPILDPISDGDESEATVVAGFRPSGPSIPVDLLADDRPIRPSSPSPAIRATGPTASVLDDEEPVAGTGRRLLLPMVLGLGALVVTALVILSVGLYVMRPGIEEVDLPAPTEVAPPVEPAPVAPPPAAPPVEPAPVTPPPAVEPAPPVAAPVAPTPTPEPAARATRPPSSTSAASTTAPSTPAPSTRTPEPEPEDDAPVRIASRAPEPTPEPAATATPTPTPTPTATSTPPAAPAAAAAFFRVEFQAGDPSITALEVKCVQGTGTGLSVVLDQVPKGNCRVTGRGGDAPLITMVTVVADRSYTCFGGRAPSCK
ncbi:MAG: hypothetical protein V4850_21025 [Myxococcota bacterium]